MKKVIFLLMLAIAMISCAGDEGPMGPPGMNGNPGQDGRPGENGKPGQDGSGVNWHTQSFTIKNSEWKLYGKPEELNSYFYADVDMPKLNDFVFDEGTVIGYMAAGKDVKNGLPYVIHMGEEIGDKEFLWTKTYDFDFAPGSIRFYVTLSDFLTNKKPGDATFHIVLMW